MATTQQPFSQIVSASVPASSTFPSNFLQSCLTISKPIPLLAPVTWSRKVVAKYKCYTRQCIHAYRVRTRAILAAITESGNYAIVIAPPPRSVWVGLPSEWSKYQDRANMGYMYVVLTVVVFLCWIRANLMLQTEPPLQLSHACLQSISIPSFRKLLSFQYF